MCETCVELRDVLQAWLNSQGHERCWYYPEVFAQLAVRLGVDPEPALGRVPRREFEAGCRRFQVEEYGVVSRPERLDEDIIRSAIEALDGNFANPAAVARERLVTGLQLLEVTR